MADDRQQQDHAYDSPAAPEVVAGSEGVCRSERHAAIKCLLAEKSVVFFGARGLGAGAEVRAALAALGDHRPNWLILEPPSVGFLGYTRRVYEVQKELVREVARFAARDTMVRSLLADWGRVEMAEPSEADDPRAVTLALYRLHEMLNDVNEATACQDQVVVLAVEQLDQWLPVPDGDDQRDCETARALGEGLAGLLKDGRGAKLKLLASASPGVALMQQPPNTALVSGVERFMLAPLSVEQVAALVTEEVGPLNEGSATDLSPAEIGRFVHDALGGHPGLVRSMAGSIRSWFLQGRDLAEADLESLLCEVSADVEVLLLDAFKALREIGHEEVVRRLSRELRGGETSPPLAAHLRLLGALGLVDRDGRVPRLLADRISQAGYLGARAAGEKAAAGSEQATHQESGWDEAPANDPAFDLGRKERRVFLKLREQVGQPVEWQELAREYFSDEPEVLQDEQKALNSLRAAINRVNAKLSPRDAASGSATKVIGYQRGAGFFVDRDVLKLIGD